MKAHGKSASDNRLTVRPPFGHFEGTMPPSAPFHDLVRNGCKKGTISIIRPAAPEPCARQHHRSDAAADDRAGCHAACI